MREVFTVSLGQHANFANAHFWNFQDELAVAQVGAQAEVDHDVLFRAGESAGAATLTPRMVVVDAKGGLGGLPQQGLLSATNQLGGGGYAAQMAAATLAGSVWSSGVQTLAQQPVAPNAYLRGLSSADSELAAELAAEAAEDEDGSADEGDEADADAEYGVNRDCDRDGGERGADDAVAQQAAPAAAAAAAPEPTADELAQADAIAAELQSSVAFWSDYLKVHVHRRTMHTLERTTRFDDFDCYAAGVEAYKSDRALEDATDDCRHFLEECDLLQGFHVLADVDTAWGGVATQLLEYIRDDYPSTPIVTFATAARGGLPAPAGGEAAAAASERASPAGVNMRKPLNTAVCMSELATHSTLVVPLSAKAVAAGRGSNSGGGVAFPSHSDYNVSALVATALETATLPYRLLADRRGRLRDLTDSLVSTRFAGARSIPLASLGVAPTLNWDTLTDEAAAQLVAGQHEQGDGFGPELAQAHLAALGARTAGTGGHLASLTPQWPSAGRRRGGSSAAGPSHWTVSALRVQPMEVYSVRGLDAWKRRAGVAASGGGSFKARNGCSSTFVGGTLPLPLCFPRIYQKHQPAAGAEPEPEPEDSSSSSSGGAGAGPLRETALATRLSNTPIALLSMVRGGLEVVSQIKSRPNAIMMAAVGGMGEGDDLLEAASDTLNSMRGELQDCFEGQGDDSADDDDY